MTGPAGRPCRKGSLRRARQPSHQLAALGSLASVRPDPTNPTMGPFQPPPWSTGADYRSQPHHIARKMQHLSGGSFQRAPPGIMTPSHSATYRGRKSVPDSTPVLGNWSQGPQAAQGLHRTFVPRHCEGQCALLRRIRCRRLTPTGVANEGASGPWRRPDGPAGPRAGHW